MCGDIIAHKDYVCCVNTKGARSACCHCLTRPFETLRGSLALPGAQEVHLSEKQGGAYVSGKEDAEANGEANPQSLWTHALKVWGCNTDCQDWVFSA